MSKFMPKTATARQLQKQYRSIFNDVVEKKEPVVIMNRNNPEVVIVDIKTYEILLDHNEKYEQKLAMEAVGNYKKEKEEGKLQELGSLSDLIDEN